MPEPPKKWGDGVYKFLSDKKIRRFSLEHRVFQSDFVFRSCCASIHLRLCFWKVCYRKVLWLVQRGKGPQVLANNRSMHTLSNQLVSMPGNLNGDSAGAKARQESCSALQLLGVWRAVAPPRPQDVTGTKYFLFLRKQFMTLFIVSLWRSLSK